MKSNFFFFRKKKYISSWFDFLGNSSFFKKWMIFRETGDFLANLLLNQKSRVIFMQWGRFYAGSDSDDVTMLGFACGVIREWRLKVRRTIMMIIPTATTTETMTSVIAIRLFCWPLNDDREAAMELSPTWTMSFRFICSVEGWFEVWWPVVSDTFLNSSSARVSLSTTCWISTRLESIFFLEGLF